MTPNIAESIRLLRLLRDGDSMRSVSIRQGQAITEVTDELERLYGLINTPHTGEFIDAIRLKAAHQRGRRRLSSMKVELNHLVRLTCGEARITFCNNGTTDLGDMLAAAGAEIDKYIQPWECCMAWNLTIVALMEQAVIMARYSQP